MSQGRGDQLEYVASIQERLKQARLDDAALDLDETARVLARRFAADAGSRDASCASPYQFSNPGVPASPAYAAPRTNTWLLILLLIIALIPSLAVGVMVWHDRSRAERVLTLRLGDAAKNLARLSTLIPKHESVQPKQSLKPQLIKLSVAKVIEAERGKKVSFPVALEPADAIEPRSTVIVRGLPAGSALSAGRPSGQDEWALAPYELKDLALTLSNTAKGSVDLQVELLTAGGTLSASTDTRIEIAEPVNPLITRPEEAERIGELIQHGQKMVQVGYLAGARAYFKRAAEAGSADAALALGATYDPSFIEEIGAQGIKADPIMARVWYQRAQQLGAPDAETKLIKLKKIVKNERPTGTIVTSAANGSAGTEEMVELSGYANLRVAPSSTAQTIRIVEKGAKLHTVGRQGSWLEVIDPETSATGWIHSRLTAALASPVP